MVTYSIVSTAAGDEVPKVNTARVVEPVPLFDLATALKLPKSAAFPVDAMVI